MLEGNPRTQDLVGQNGSTVQALHLSSNSDSVHIQCPAHPNHNNETITPSPGEGHSHTACPALSSADSDGRLTREDLSEQTDQAGGMSSTVCQPQISPVQPGMVMATPSEEPPPYSPPDPKMAYMIYPPQPPHYPGPPVIACQPGPNQPAFYQAQFMPSPSYPPYTIVRRNISIHGTKSGVFKFVCLNLVSHSYCPLCLLGYFIVCVCASVVFQYMNGPPLGDEQAPVPKDYMVESLLVTIFCCLMSGLIALMYSYEVRRGQNFDIRMWT